MSGANPELPVVFLADTADKRSVRPMRQTVRVALVVLTALVVSIPAGAHARRDRGFNYRFEQVWSAVMRLVRVDYGFPVRDRNRRVGYLLFDYRNSHGSYPGSFEIIRRKTGQKRVRVVLKIPEMPSYVERMMLDKLKKKLKRNFGRPLPRPRRREREERSERQDEGEKDEEDKSGDNGQGGEEKKRAEEEDGAGSGDE